LVSDVLVPEVGDEGEDFRRDAVDRCETIPPGSDQAEDLGSVLLEGTYLRGGMFE